MPDLWATTRAARHLAIAFAVISFACLVLESAFVYAAHFEHELSTKGQLATMTVDRVHVGRMSDSVTGRLANGQDATARVKPGLVRPGDQLDVLALPGHQHVQPADPGKAIPSGATQTLLLGGTVLAVFVWLSVRQLRTSRRLRALARSPGEPHQVWVDYRLVGGPKARRWVALVSTEQASLRLRLAKRPRPRPRSDQGLPEAAQAWGDLSAGGYLLLSPSSGRLVSPNGPLTEGPHSWTPTLVVIALLILAAVLLL